MVPTISLQLRAIERLGERLRLPAAGPQHDELLDALDTAQKPRGRALEHCPRQLGARRLEPGPLIRAVAGALDQSEVGDVARDRGLRGVESALSAGAAGAASWLWSASLVDEFENDGLACGLSSGSVGTPEDTRFTLRSSRLFIDFC